MKPGTKSGPKGGAAMSFTEIASALGYRDPEGVGRRAVWMLYCSAMQKLRSRPRSLQKLREIAAARQRVIAERGVAPDWEG